VLELVTRQLAQLIKRLGICQINMVKKINGVMDIWENKYACCVIKAVAARHSIEARPKYKKFICISSVKEHIYNFKPQ
jgi:hypothetical protein